ncbi:MAG: PHP domain-containing protein [Alphaproteobacteria bacterium]|nr:PHP domain-containing protein [Alphaproteobacteria bacterium]
MINIQKYSYHTHNNSQGLFDGKSSAEEMIAQAEALGFEEIGVSNHLCVHPNVPLNTSKMFFDNPQRAIEIYKKMYNELDEVASRHKIKVFKGFEVDFFPSATWRSWFEAIIKELDYDYLIGASHFICAADESFLCNIYHLNKLPADTDSDRMQEYLRGYWKNVQGAVESGYFDFIAHFDYCTQFDLCTTPEWDEIKQNVIDAFSSHKQPFEINTGGIERIGRPFPDWNMAEKLVRRGVPVVISCDSHHTSQIGRHFVEVENFLANIGCKYRFKLQK